MGTDLIALFCLIENKLGDQFESIEHANALDCRCFEKREIIPVEVGLQFRNPHDIGQVALVVLQHDRQRHNVVAVFDQVFFQVVQRLDVFISFRALRVADKYHAVNSAQDEFTGGIVEDLTRHGVELEFGGKAVDRTDVDRQEVEVERTVCIGRKTDQITARLFRHFRVHVLQVGCLSRQAGSIVDNLAVDFPT